MVNYNHQPVRDPMTFPPAAPRLQDIDGFTAGFESRLCQRKDEENSSRDQTLLLTCGIPKSWGILQIPKMMG